MADYVLWYQASGKAGGGLATDHPELLPPVPEGAVWVPLVGSHLDTTLALVNGVRTEVPITLPASSALALARVEALAVAKAYRDARQGGGCTTAIGRVDTDEQSMLKLNSMAAAAAGSIAAKTAFPIKTWTLANGTDVALTATKGVAAQTSVTAMSDACQQAYAAVKALLLAAPSLAALAAIDITAGYPA